MKLKKLLLFAFRLALAVALAFGCLSVVLTAASYPAFAQTSTPLRGCEQHPNDQFCALAQRFRPYLKFSISGEGMGPESIRPSVQSSREIRTLRRAYGCQSDTC